VKLELLKYYDYCKQRKVEVRKSLDIRDLRINALLDVSESNLYKECLDNLNIVLSTLDKKEKEIDILISSLTNLSDADLDLLRKEMESFAELINTSIQYIEYINSTIKEIIKI
jgi:ABC-type transporter Mla subunit MlaD